ncbi:hypothetical protein S245_055756 [Arachis hypogaea]
MEVSDDWMLKNGDEMEADGDWTLKNDDEMEDCFLHFLSSHFSSLSSCIEFKGQRKNEENHYGFFKLLKRRCLEDFPKIGWIPIRHTDRFLAGLTVFYRFLK